MAGPDNTDNDDVPAWVIAFLATAAEDSEPPRDIALAEITLPRIETP